MQHARRPAADSPAVLAGKQCERACHAGCWLRRRSSPPHQPLPRPPPPKNKNKNIKLQVSYTSPSVLSTLSPRALNARVPAPPCVLAQVGYISPDLFTHSVSYFAEAPLAHHSSRSVRTIVYSCVPKASAGRVLGVGPGSCSPSLVLRCNGEAVAFCAPQQCACTRVQLHSLACVCACVCGHGLPPPNLHLHPSACPPPAGCQDGEAAGRGGGGRGHVARRRAPVGARRAGVGVQGMAGRVWKAATGWVSRSRCAHATAPTYFLTPSLSRHATPPHPPCRAGRSDSLRQGRHSGGADGAHGQQPAGCHGAPPSARAGKRRRPPAAPHPFVCLSVCPRCCPLDACLPRAVATPAAAASTSSRQSAPTSPFTPGHLCTPTSARQVSWIGYPNSTGLRSVDYRLTDSTCDPQGTAQTFTGALACVCGAQDPGPAAWMHGGVACRAGRRRRGRALRLLARVASKEQPPRPSPVLSRHAALVWARSSHPRPTPPPTPPPLPHPLPPCSQQRSSSAWPAASCATPRRPTRRRWRPCPP